jgi:hypothetical protein
MLDDLQSPLEEPDPEPVLGGEESGRLDEDDEIARSQPADFPERLFGRRSGPVDHGRAGESLAVGAGEEGRERRAEVEENQRAAIRAVFDRARQDRSDVVTGGGIRGGRSGVDAPMLAGPPRPWTERRRREKHLERPPVPDSGD